MIRHFSIVAVLVLAAATSVYAQNNKPITSGTYYEDQATGSADYAYTILKFMGTPTNKYLNITNVSCEFAVAPNTTIETISVIIGTSSGEGDVGRSLQIRGNGTSTSTGYNGKTDYHLVQNGLFYKIGPGRYPSILASGYYSGGNGSVGTISGTCVIIGALSDN